MIQNQQNSLDYTNQEREFKSDDNSFEGQFEVEQAKYWYLLLPPPVFYTFLNHGGADDKDERNDGTNSRIRRKGCEGEDSGDQEVKVGHPPELLKQGFGQESGNCILRAPDIVVSIIVNPGFETSRVIAMNYPRESRSPNLRMVFLERCLATSK